MPPSHFDETEGKHCCEPRISHIRRKGEFLFRALHTVSYKTIVMADAAEPDHKRLRLEPSAGAPLVSVIMPVYNAAAFLPETLDSVLAQTHRPIELSIYVDASDDGSLEVGRRGLGKLGEGGDY